MPKWLREKMGAVYFLRLRGEMKRGTGVLSRDIPGKSGKWDLHGCSCFSISRSSRQCDHWQVRLFTVEFNFLFAKYYKFRTMCKYWNRSLCNNNLIKGCTHKTFSIILMWLMVKLYYNSIRFIKWITDWYYCAVNYPYDAKYPFPRREL